MQNNLKRWKKPIFIGISVFVVVLMLGGVGFLGYRAVKKWNTQVTEARTTQSSQIEQLGKSQKEQELKVNDSLSSVPLNLEINGEKVAINMSKNVIKTEAPTLNVDAKNHISLDVPQDTEVTVNGEKYENGGGKLTTSYIA